MVILKMGKIIVTGANGFIGRHVIELLKKTDHFIYALTTNAENKSNDDKLNWYEIDLLNEREIAAFFKTVNEPTQLLHLAWDTTPGQYWNSKLNLKWVQGSLSLFDHFCAAGGKRIVGTGTCAEYDLTTGICYEEQTALSYSSTYSSCKNALQHMLESYGKTHHISTAWARLFYMYGPFEHPARLVASVICALLQGQSADCTHGRQIRDYLYVKDVASALVALLDHDVCGPVNIGSGMPYRLNEIVNEIGIIMGSPELVKLDAIRAPEHEPPVIVADIRTLSNQVQWKPSYTLKEGLLETIIWWRNQKAFSSC
jgi:nucleoside-diphosphate-sugar epimerase